MSDQDVGSSPDRSRSRSSSRMIPRSFFLTRGVGTHRDYLQSLELALRNAGIQHLNLVKVSSIIPPGCRLIKKEEGLEASQPGEIVFAVLDKNSTNEPHRLVSASVGVAIPSEESSYGYLSEHHTFGVDKVTAGNYSEDLAATMLATVKGIVLDSSMPLEEKKRVLKGRGVGRITNVTQTASGDKNGLWTTVVAAAVFVM